MLKLSRVVARNSGRLLLTVADLATVLAPVSADWNGSHLFNEEWPSHARLHGAVRLGTPVALASFARWHLWRGFRGRSVARAVAAAVPISYLGSFFPALLIPGTGVDDPPHPVGRSPACPRTSSGPPSPRHRRSPAGCSMRVCAPRRGARGGAQ